MDLLQQESVEGKRQLRGRERSYCQEKMLRVMGGLVSPAGSSVTPKRRPCQKLWESPGPRNPPGGGTASTGLGTTFLSSILVMATCSTTCPSCSRVSHEVHFAGTEGGSLLTFPWVLSQGHLLGSPTTGGFLERIPMARGLLRTWRRVSRTLCEVGLYHG